MVSIKRGMLNFDQIHYRIIIGRELDTKRIYLTLVIALLENGKVTNIFVVRNPRDLSKIHREKIGVKFDVVDRTKMENECERIGRKLGINFDCNYHGIYISEETANLKKNDIEKIYEGLFGVYNPNNKKATMVFLMNRWEYYRVDCLQNDRVNPELAPILKMDLALK
jgi:hypothetical protein